ncbi:DNA alkylation repair protein [Kaistella jeonii]|uniref:DNA alkylation repair protein n=1 Tax=Kaistella jeonii TaxID=266749 RepID=A0A0C1FQP9_9FLAO|nr:DNA alkylation repair protein [Kaistella jeonii]KIA90194.1 DNA alkylation repair protein [Kaistella jeonii]SFB76487.1 3-methyladenine DNA glycosylase AlkD [Kaistella jeonii]VEI96488.1 DNA alkylation repair enzyme [Kaistella jeonii]
MVDQIKSALQELSILEKKEILGRFFKTGKGEYADGDQFIGVTVPDQRKIAKNFENKISLQELEKLLSSPIHEHRHCALFILVSKFEKSKDLKEKKEIVEFYLKNREFINNWDLVDTSCYKILGRYCFENQDDTILEDLSEEDNLWSKRIAVVATMFHVKKGSFDLLKELALKNLHHEHDLMHKANGWLLREMGKKDQKELLDFLNLHYRKMPRTTLRYAIERLDEDIRQDFLKGRI